MVDDSTSAGSRRAMMALAATGLAGAALPTRAQDRAVDRELLAAVAAGDTVAVRRLIAAGGDVNAQDSRKDSAFLLAGALGHTEIVRLTLAAGADLKRVNRFGGTALIPACHHGHLETVRELLKTAIDVDHVNNLGWTALLEAIILGDGGPVHTEIVKLLVQHKARIDLADREGVTPLAHARRRGQTAIAQLLIAAGAR